MFNKTYLRILAICFVIAAPLAWYVVTRWLENFAYKTPLHWWVYLLALFAVGIITVAMGPCSQKQIDVGADRLDEVCMHHALEMKLDEYIEFRFNNMATTQNNSNHENQSIFTNHFS